MSVSVAVVRPNRDQDRLPAHEGRVGMTARGYAGAGRTGTGPGNAWLGAEEGVVVDVGDSDGETAGQLLATRASSRRKSLRCWMTASSVSAVTARSFSPVIVA